MKEYVNKIQKFFDLLQDMDNREKPIREFIPDIIEAHSNFQMLEINFIRVMEEKKHQEPLRYPCHVCKGEGIVTETSGRIRTCEWCDAGYIYPV